MCRKPKESVKIVYCMCPKCKFVRQRAEGKYNIIQRGYERNGIARFFCTNCKTWFNQKTGRAMEWYKRF